jgi:hypothetical protein
MISYLLAFLAGLAPAPPSRTDAFAFYFNRTLARVIEAEGTREVKRLAPAEIADHDRVLPGVTGTFLVVKTNDGRHAKLLVQAGRKKIDAEGSVPILLVERYVTFREGEERAIQASGQNVMLFPGFRLSLDLGQIVPAELGGDLRLVVAGDQVHVEPVGKARLYLVTKALPDVPPRKGPKLVVGNAFEPRYFNGTYQLHDDGRRSGTLILKVDETGTVTGSYFTDRDGTKYEVHGKIGTPNYAVQFTIKFPRAEQTFQGMLFTGNAQAIAGTSRLAEREAAFYALRMEE